MVVLFEKDHKYWLTKVNGGIEIWLDESDTVKDDNGDDPDTLLDFVMVTRDSERLDRGLSLI